MSRLIKLYTAFNSSLAAKLRVIRLVKLLLSSVLIYVVYQQVKENFDSFEILRNALSSVKGVYYLSGVLLLMPINWMIEAYKWYSFVSVFQSFSFRKSISSVLSGVTLGLVTPARLGEYGGKLNGIHSEHRSKALISNAVSSIAQNISSISFGLFSIVLYSANFLAMSRSAFVALIGLSVLALAVMLFVFFNLEILMHLRRYQRIGIVRTIINQASFLSDYDAIMLRRVLLLSYARYFVYLAQYVLLILLFGITRDVYLAILGVGVIYFIQTGLPLPPVLSILARGEVAIWVWSVCSQDSFSILAATFILWIINLVIPAFGGMLLIWRSKL